MIGGIGLPELVIILLVVLVIFGPSRLPKLGKSFAKSATSFRRELKEGLEEEEKSEKEQEREQLERDIRGEEDEDDEVVSDEEEKVRHDA